MLSVIFCTRSKSSTQTKISFRDTDRRTDLITYETVGDPLKRGARLRSSSLWEYNIARKISRFTCPWFDRDLGHCVQYLIRRERFKVRSVKIYNLKARQRIIYDRKTIVKAAKRASPETFDKYFFLHLICDFKTWNCYYFLVK